MMKRRVHSGVAVLVLAHVGAATAATLQVPFPFPTIQQAINAANDGDIVNVSPGTYAEHVNFAGKDITVQSQNPEQDSTVAATVIDGGDAGGPTVTFENSETRDAILSGFTIIGGTGKLDAGLMAGGGIFCKNASPIIRRNVLRDNAAAAGAGGYFSGAAALVERNSIRANVASHSGGGLKLVFDSQAEVRNNLITGNRTQTLGGAGIDCFSCPAATSPLIRNNVLAGNFANSKGSAISCSAASPLVINNVTTDNRGGAGAMFQDGGSVPDVCYNDVWSNVPTDHHGCANAPATM